MFKVNLSFIISSIIRTIIFIVIFGAVLYFLKSFSPDFYNKEIYSRVTGKEIVLLDNSINNVEVNNDIRRNVYSAVEKLLTHCERNAEKIKIKPTKFSEIENFQFQSQVRLKIASNH